MMEYVDVLKHYGFTDELSRDYLSRFWLSNEELANIALPLKEKVFNNKTFCDSENSDLHFFNNMFSSYVLKGGLLFYEQSFIAALKISKALGEKFLYVLEDFGDEKDLTQQDFPFRFKYENKVSWDEICIKDESFSYHLFGTMVRNYFVFGDSGTWGKYVANDYIWPLELIGYCKDIKHIICKHMSLSAFLPQEDKEDLLEWRPDQKEFFQEGWDFLEK